MQQTKIADLISTLRELQNYHSAPSDFVRFFGKKINNDTLHRKTFHDILSGNITFERDKWANYLPLACEVAQQVLVKHKLKFEKEVLHKIQPKEFFNFDKSIKYVENTLEGCDYLFEKGEMNTSLKQISNLNELIKIEHIYKTNPYMFGYFHLVFAKLQMQFGVTDGSLGSVSLVQKSIATFENLEKEQTRLLQSVNLEGHIYRQLKHYEKAINVFEKAKKIIFSMQTTQTERNKSLMNIDHQIALTLMRQGEASKKHYFFEEAKRLLSISNEYFENSDDEKWFKFSKLREAELLLKCDEIEKAEKILDFYEDPCEITLMTRARIAIFHRINTERYLKANDVKNALRYFKAGVTLSSEENYKHELEQLTKIYLSYRLLREQLPDDFSVSTPVWK